MNVTERRGLELTFYDVAGVIRLNRLSLAPTKRELPHYYYCYNYYCYYSPLRRIQKIEKMILMMMIQGRQEERDMGSLKILDKFCQWLLWRSQWKAFIKWHLEPTTIQHPHSHTHTHTHTHTLSLSLSLSLTLYYLVITFIQGKACHVFFWSQ